MPQDYIDRPMTTRQRDRVARVPAGDEAAFQRWYSNKASKHRLNPNPDAPDQLYDYRAAFRAGSEPDASEHWPSEFKKPGHPNEIVGGFNTRTGAREPGTDGRQTRLN
jgi:hypothetical protein